MPLSPHFILPTPCTFMMTSHFSRPSQPLPGVRELFPDLFHPRTIPNTHNPLPLSPTHDSPRQRTPYDVTNPPFANFQSSSNRSTAQDPASGTTDHPPIPAYTRPPMPTPSHVPPHAPATRPHQCPSHNPAASPSPSPELSPTPQPPLHNGIGSSSLPEDGQYSSPTASPPQLPLTQLPSQSTSFEENSLEPHSGKKRHKCNICGSRWGRPSSLKIHMVSHTGVKEFVCSICKQDFGVKSNYTRHIKVHHKDSSEGIPTRAPGRRRRGSRRSRGVGPMRFVDEGPKFQSQ